MIGQRIVGGSRSPVLLLALLLAMWPPALAAQSGGSPHGELRTPVECSACHTTQGWQTMRQDAQFDHARDAGFVLAGRHGEATCSGCHLDLRFDRPRARTTDCATCHLDVHQGRLDTDCASCHNTRSFEDAASLEQHARGRFPLTGSHIGITCESCHTGETNGSFTPLDDQCWSCHAADYESAQSIDHDAAGLPKQCEQCHDAVTWRSAEFDHSLSGFPLEGRHQTTPCAECHSGPGGALPVAPAGPADCEACHRPDYEEEHAAEGYPLECAGCHSAAGWERDAFDHAAEAHGFALLGMHAQAPCSDCHAGGSGDLLFSASGQEDCVACHQPEYDTEHGGSGYPLTCGRCHSVNGWSGAEFEHASAANGFDLVGQHRIIECNACHTAPDNALRWTVAGQDDCIACHRPDYDTEHTGSGYPTSCGTCHDSNDWSHAVVDHVTIGNGFALVGAHVAASCRDCHAADNTLLFPTPANANDCVVCHQPEYDEEHGGTSIPTTCLDCHSTDTFTGAVFDHSQTAFPLDGAHAAAQCETCHGPGGTLIVPVPSGPADCVACHQTEFDAEHSGSGFPTTCLDCHSTDTFTGATFDHSSTAFPLQGAHVAAACATCHGPNGTLLFPQPSSPIDCLACHQTDYDSEHAGSGYPTNCLACHDQIDFSTATFDHDAQFFPIYSRKHRGKWNACADCHPSSADYAVFTCLSCHEHRKSEMDDKHKGEPGYSYDSQACLGCHPTGEE